MMHMKHVIIAAAGTTGFAAIAVPSSRTPFGGVVRGVTVSFGALAPATV